MCGPHIWCVVRAAHRSVWEGGAAARWWHVWVTYHDSAPATCVVVHACLLAAAHMVYSAPFPFPCARPPSTLEDIRSSENIPVQALRLLAPAAPATQMVLGRMNVSDVTIADFLGPAGCGGPGAGTFAIANHPGAPEAFHPHYFSRMNVVNTPVTGYGGWSGSRDGSGSWDGQRWAVWAGSGQPLVHHSMCRHLPTVCIAHQSINQGRCCTV